MPKAIVSKVLIYALSLVLAYACGIGFVFLFVSEPNLVEIVSSCKVVSLLILIYANREIPESVDIDQDAGLARANFLIIILSGLILILMVVKTVSDEYAAMQFPPQGQMVVQVFSRNSYWLSVLPVFAYCLLDLYLAFGRRDCRVTDRDNAIDFVIFRDLVCAAPLALVLLLAEVYVHFSSLPDARASAEFFFSGALAVIMLSSALATKTLNLVHEERAHVVEIEEPRRLRDDRVRAI